MSMNISLNFCQKTCVTISPGSCVSSSIIWTVSDPNIVAITSNGNNVIIKPVYGAIGKTVVMASYLDGTSLLIFVTVTSFFDSIIPPILPKYKYIYSTSVTYLITGSSSTISGPFNPLIIPFSTNICTLVKIQNVNINTFSSLFIPGTNSIIKVFHSNSFGSTSTNCDFMLFETTADSDPDSLLPFASPFISGLPISTTGTFSTYSFPTNIILPCDSVNYITLVQLNSSTNPNGFVITSNLSDQNYITFQTTGFSSSTQCSAIIVPSGYFNILSNSLIYTTIISITATTNPQTISVTVPSMPVGTVIWSAQQHDNTTTAMSIPKITQTTTTNINLTVDVLAATGSPLLPFTANISIVAYKNQSNAGFSATTP